MLNQVQLIGFTGADADIRTTQGGKQVATVRVCTSRITRKDGERKDYPTWHQVEIWTPATVKWLADKGLPKGAKILVQGEGWRVWGTKPSEISTAARGDVVAFTATVSASDDDDSFGFYSRPTKAHIIAAGIRRTA